MSEKRFTVRMSAEGGDMVRQDFDQLGESARDAGDATGRIGERSAMAVDAALRAGVSNACHLSGGMDAWKAAQGPVA